IKKMKSRRTSHTICNLAAAAAVATAAYGCRKEEDSGKKKSQQAFPVSATKAVSRNIPWNFDTFGAVEAFSSVNINSLVGGKIIKVGFVPGQKVKKGDILAQIDSRPYEASLKQIEANMERDTVLANDAERQARVKSELHRKNAVSEDDMFKTKAVSESLKRAVKNDEANMDKARLDVEYCTIKSPFDGRVGDILIHEGSIIKANDNIIATVSAATPAYVAFSLPERFLPVIQKLMAKGKKVEVTAKIEAAKKDITSKGELCFIDNTVNQNSGTVRMKALFPNTDETLWPGQFVDVSVELSSGETYTAISSDAIQNGQLGQQVFIVKNDSTVELRQVEVERTASGFSAISKGLQPGETVVLTGQFRLVPDAKVSIVSTGAEKRPETAAEKE
ncbi:MAG: efflux RND transporter periplasmic adaptor subunit, partial [Victivallales bacterium]